MIGILGGIGSGKSAVADAFAALGCVVARSDEDGRAALRDPAIRAELRSWWGPGILDAEGEVDRRRVAEIVFSDPAERRRLERLTHPWIERRRLALFAAAPAEAPAFVIDAPLLLEAGLDARCTHLVFVEVEEPTRLARVAASRGWSPEDLRRREAAQRPLDEKRRRADHVVRNDGDLADLGDRVRRVLHSILENRERS